VTGLGPGTRCSLQGGLTIAAENELYEYQDRGWPLKPWMVGYVKHQQDKTCPDCFGSVVSLSEFRYRREEECEEWDWTARFRGWARTLAAQDNRTPRGGWTGDDYLELCGVIAELLEGWADELEGKPGSSS
jgi:hypothetical protein